VLDGSVGDGELGKIVADPMRCEKDGSRWEMGDRREENLHLGLDLDLVEFLAGIHAYNASLESS
jgi:hypothetical protein